MNEPTLTQRTVTFGGKAPAAAPLADAPVIPGYEILAMLGRGGMGVVYQGRHLALKRLVAIKMLLGDHADPDAVARFKVEAESAARLQHPNIVQVFEVGEAGGRPYCALEYVGGGSLAQKLAGAPLPPRQAAELAEDLARAVQAAHDKGIVHRDLKPANVLLASVEGEASPSRDREGTALDSTAGSRSRLGPLVKVADFGLAKQLDADSAQTKAGTVLGTPSYMAPEQARGEAVGPAADVYALGAILYECLTGRPPFKGATVLETLEQVSTLDAVAPSTLQPSVPRDLDTIALKCLHKDRAKRYATAAELADDLRRFQTGEPIRARAVGAVERAAKWVRRRPGVAALFALLAVSLLTGTVVSALFAIEAGERAAEADRQAGIAREREADAKAAARRAADKEQDAKTSALDAREQARRALASGYVSDVALAHQLWRGGEVAAARQLLDRCPLALRHWEWRYLDQLCKQGLGHLAPSESPLAVAFAPRADLLAVVNVEAVVLYSTTPLRETLRVPVKVVDPDEPVLMQTPALRFRADSEELALANGRFVWRIDVRGGKVLEKWTIPDGKSSADALAYAPDGRLLVAGWHVNDSQLHPVMVYDVARNEAVATIDSGFKSTGGIVLRRAAVALSADGKRVAVLAQDTGMRSGSGPKVEAQDKAGTDDFKIQVFAAQVRAWDVATGKLLRTLPANDNYLAGLAFSPDGKRLALGQGGAALEVHLDAPGQDRRLEGPARDVLGLAYSSDGRWLAGGTADKTIWVWNVGGTEPPVTLRGHAFGVTALAWRSDGVRLASVGRVAFSAVSEARLWDPREQPGMSRQKTPRADMALVTALRPDARAWVLTRLDPKAGEPPTEIYVAGKAEPIARLELPPGTSAVVAAFSANGRWLAIGGRGKIHVFDAVTGKLVKALDVPAPQELRDTLPGLAFSPDGKRLALAGVHERHDPKGAPPPRVRVNLWDTATWAPVGAWSTAVSLRPEAGDAEHASLPGSAGLVFSPDGKRLAAGVLFIAGHNGLEMRGELFVWEGDAGKPVHQRPIDFGLTALAWAGDRLALVGGSLAEGYGLLFDTGTWEIRHNLTGHARLMHAAAFSADGKRLATSGTDLAIKVWDVDSGRELLSLTGHRRAVTLLAFDPDGQRLLSATGLDMEDMVGVGTTNLTQPVEVRLWGAAPE